VGGGLLLDGERDNFVFLNFLAGLISVIVAIAVGVGLIVLGFVLMARRNKKNYLLVKQKYEVLGVIFNNNVEAYKNIDLKYLCEQILVFKNYKGVEMPIEVDLGGLNNVSDNLFHFNAVNRQMSLVNAFVFKFDGVNMCLSENKFTDDLLFGSDYVNDKNQFNDLSASKAYKKDGFLSTVIKGGAMPSFNSRVVFSVVVPKFEDLTFSVDKFNNSESAVDSFYKKNTSLTHMDYDQFDKTMLFNRNSEEKFRVLFTPLVQTQLVQIFDKDNPFNLCKKFDSLIDVFYQNTNGIDMTLNHHVNDELTESRIISSLIIAFTNAYYLIDKHLKVYLEIASIQAPMFKRGIPTTVPTYELTASELEIFFNKASNRYLFKCPSNKKGKKLQKEVINNVLDYNSTTSSGMVTKNKKGKTVGTNVPGFIKVYQLSKELFQVHTNFYEYEGNGNSSGFRTTRGLRLGGFGFGGSAFASSASNLTLVKRSRQFVCAVLPTDKKIDRYYKYDKFDDFFKYLSQNEVFDVFELDGKLCVVASSQSTLDDFLSTIK
jgi:hypothetical protein